MKVLFDYRIFYHQKSGGITRYILNLSKELNNINYSNQILAPIHINNMLKEFSTFFNNVDGIYIKNKPIFSGKILNFINYSFTKLLLDKINPKVYHQTYYGTFPKSKKIIKVVTVHDLIHEKFFEDYGMSIDNRPKKESLEQADKIICVSNSTKADLLNYYNVDEKKIKIIGHGHEHIIGLIDNNKIIDRKNEILYIGGRGKYKNFKNFIKAFISNEKIKKYFKIVCFGGGKFNLNEMNLFHEKKINDKISYIDGNDLVLARLYKSSTCMIYPSLYEGFGLPVIEAMALGCPVVAGNCKPIMETAGDAALFFNPMDVEDISQKLEASLNPNNTNILIERGFQQIKNYKWNDCAKKTLNFYNE